MEIWDSYNSDGSKADIDLIRGEEIPEGYYHLVVDVLVIHTDGDILIMQRDFNKEGWPGCYEATAGGSATKGETSIQAAKRELSEETGLLADKLEFIQRKVSDRSRSIYDQYRFVYDGPKDVITLQEGETVDYKWLDRESFLEVHSSDQYAGSHRNRFSEIKGYI